MTSPGTQALIEAATAARAHAHCPYSGFAVGAAVRDAAGRVFVGANVENASYGLGVCAERVALWTARVAGAAEILEVVVVTEARRPTTPCGACRQVLAELAPRAGGCSVTTAGASLDWTVAQLLPRAFGADDLA